MANFQYHIYNYRHLDKIQRHILVKVMLIYQTTIMITIENKKTEYRDPPSCCTCWSIPSCRKRHLDMWRGLFVRKEKLLYHLSQSLSLFYYYYQVVG